MNLSRRIAARALLSLAAILFCASAHARIPDGWPFLEFNEAVKVAKEQRRPLFVYFGFDTCPYCRYLNEHTLASPSLRRQYTSHYVLAYFDIRGNRDDEMTLPDGAKMTRAEAIRRLSGSPVPAWMFVVPDGRTVLMRRGARAKVNDFWKYDLYVASGAYKDGTFEEFLVRRGLREENSE